LEKQVLADIKCNDCGNVEERFWQSKEQPHCSKCGGQTTKLISSNWAFNFKDGRGTDMGLTTSYPSSYKQIKRG
jgi:hypothetical protein